jgi:hypothetical protein
LSFAALPRQKEGLDQIALSTDSHSGESFEPLPFGHLGLAVQPPREELKLAGMNAMILDPVKQVLEELWRYVFAEDLGHLSNSVEASSYSLFEARRFFGVTGGGELLAQSAYLAGAEEMSVSLQR